MTMRAKTVFMIVAAALFAGSAVYADDTSATADKMMAAVTPGELVLTGSEVKNIHKGKEAKEYRVCVKTETQSAPMKVMYDGQEVALNPGDCKEVIGKKIDVTPEHALTGKAHIVATFHNVKK
jgi:hypothetical protein